MMISRVETHARHSAIKIQYNAPPFVGSLVAALIPADTTSLPPRIISQLLLINDATRLDLEFSKKHFKSIDAAQIGECGAAECHGALL
jgi:hypothetical protein